MSLNTLRSFRRVHRGATARLYESGGGLRLGLSEDEFARGLRKIAARYFGNERKPAREEIESYLSSIRAEETALAIACWFWKEDAWKAFLGRYWEQVLRLAAALCTGDKSSRDSLAGSFLTELAGTGRHWERRRSLFMEYSGRRPLSLWLIVELSRHVPEWRYRMQGGCVRVPKPPPRRRGGE